MQNDYGKHKKSLRRNQGKVGILSEGSRMKEITSEGPWLFHKNLIIGWNKSELKLGTHTHSDLTSPSRPQRNHSQRHISRQQQRSFPVTGSITSKST